MDFTLVLTGPYSGPMGALESKEIRHVPTRSSSLTRLLMALLIAICAGSGNFAPVPSAMAQVESDEAESVRLESDNVAVETATEDRKTDILVSGTRIGDEVLEWFAEQSDLSFALDVTPAGSFTYIDDEEFYAGRGVGHLEWRADD